MELRSLEIFYLSLTILSPFFGATLLRYVAIAISGDPKTLSWFSTSLFVLATGVRPWTHLAERLKDRSRALNEILDNSLPDESEAISEEEEGGEAVDPSNFLNEDFTDLQNRFKVLDSRINDLASTNIHEWEDISEAVYGIEGIVRQLKLELGRRTEASEARLDTLETFVLSLQRNNGLKLDSTNSIHLRTILWGLVSSPRNMLYWCWDSTHGCISNTLLITENLWKRVIKRNSAFGFHFGRHHPLESSIAEQKHTIIPKEDNRSVLPSDDSDMTLVPNSPAQEMKIITRYLELLTQIILFMLLPFTIVFRPILFFISLPFKVLRRLKPKLI